MINPSGLSNFLSQVESSDMSDFFSQISGLVILTCAIGVLWLLLVVLVAQRAGERRRRAAKGLPPLPGIHETVYKWIVRRLNPESQGETSGEAPPADRAPVIQRIPSKQPPTAAPLPDLGMLTGDLGAPEPEPMSESELAEMFPEPEPEDIYPAEDEPVPADTGAVPGEEPLPEPVPRPGVGEAAAAGEPADSVELLRVWRDLSTGSLVLEIGGQRFESLRDLRSADLERRFLNVVRDLDAVARPARKITSDRAAAQAPGADDLTPPPSMSPGSMLRQMTRVAMGHTPTPAEELPALNIADEIETLLQFRLDNLPSFSDRSIHVRPSIEGGVRIEVDGTFYDGIDEVEDDDVRDLLIDVVQEWESQK
jgi:hypothetical protein